MDPETLDFEEPIGQLLKKLDTLAALPTSPALQQQMSELRREVAALRRQCYAALTPWQQVLVARHPDRPHTLDYVKRILTDFIAIHGDRRFADDPSIVCGFAYFDAQPVLLVGHQKGRGTKENIRRNFGYARPEGYRKALRAMRLAEKFGRPIIVFVDTPAAYPGARGESVLGRKRGTAPISACPIHSKMSTSPKGNWLAGRCEKIGDCHKRLLPSPCLSVNRLAAAGCPHHFFTASCPLFSRPRTCTTGC